MDPFGISSSMRFQCPRQIHRELCIYRWEIIFSKFPHSLPFLRTDSETPALQEQCSTSTVQLWDSKSSPMTPELRWDFRKLLPLTTLNSAKVFRQVKLWSGFWIQNHKKKHGRPSSWYHFRWRRCFCCIFQSSDASSGSAVKCRCWIPSITALQFCRNKMCYALNSSSVVLTVSELPFLC